MLSYMFFPIHPSQTIYWNICKPRNRIDHRKSRGGAIRRSTSTVSPRVSSEERPFLGEQASVTQRLFPCNVWVDRHVWGQRCNYVPLIDAQAASAPAGPGSRHVSSEEIRHKYGNDFHFTLRLPPYRRPTCFYIKSDSWVNWDFENVQTVITKRNRQP